MRQLKEQRGRLPKELGKAVGEDNWVVASFKGLPNTLIPFNCPSSGGKKCLFEEIYIVPC